jgi:hypothetical protein
MYDRKIPAEAVLSAIAGHPNQGRVPILDSEPYLIQYEAQDGCKSTPLAQPLLFPSSSVYTFKFNMKGFARNILATLPLVASTLGAILNGN